MLKNKSEMPPPTPPRPQQVPFPVAELISLQVVISAWVTSAAHFQCLGVFCFWFCFSVWGQFFNYWDRLSDCHLEGEAWGRVRRICEQSAGHGVWGELAAPVLLTGYVPWGKPIKAWSREPLAGSFLQLYHLLKCSRLRLGGQYFITRLWGKRGPETLHNFLSSRPQLGGSRAGVRTPVRPRPAPAFFPAHAGALCVRVPCSANCRCWT